MQTWKTCKEKGRNEQSCGEKELNCNTKHGVTVGRKQARVIEGKLTAKETDKQTRGEIEQNEEIFARISSKRIVIKI